LKKKNLLICLLITLFSVYSFSAENEIQQELVIDLPKFTEVHSLDEGSVLNIGYNPELGNFIEVEYPKLEMKVKYCNLQTMRVLRGQTISKQEVFCLSGETGSVNEPCMNIKISINYNDKKDFNLADYVPYIDGMATVYSIKEVKYVKLRFFSSMFQNQFFFCMNGDEITGYNKMIEYQEPFELSGATENIISVFSCNKAEFEKDTQNAKYIKLGLLLLEDY